MVRALHGIPDYRVQIQTFDAFRDLWLRQPIPWITPNIQHHFIGARLEDGLKLSHSLVSPKFEDETVDGMNVHTPWNSRFLSPSNGVFKLEALRRITPVLAAVGRIPAVPWIECLEAQEPGSLARPTLRLWHQS
jgi:hypothetical protein